MVALIASGQGISQDTPTIVKQYPRGVTELPVDSDGGAQRMKRIVVIGNKGWVYTKTVYSWGTFYFKDGVQTSQQIFEEETNVMYVKNKNDEYDAAHPKSH